MGLHRTLPQREQVFITSLMRHGYRFTRERSGLKRRKRYIIPATKQEDAAGVDFWVKPPKCTRLIAVQITQRGVSFHAKYHPATVTKLDELAERSRHRLRKKRGICKRDGVAFVLVRDCLGSRPSNSLAWGDAKALRNGIKPFIAMN